MRDRLNETGVPLKIIALFHNQSYIPEWHSKCVYVELY
jgi:hypothetical protein